MKIMDDDFLPKRAKNHYFLIFIYTFTLIITRKFGIITLESGEKTYAPLVKGYCTVKKCVTDKISGVCDRLCSDNPLLMRKKVSMHDVYYKRDDPSRELVKFEFSFDLELYVIIITCAAALFILLWKAARCIARSRAKNAIRRDERKRLRMKKKYSL